MATTYLATMMDAGKPKWRAGDTIGFNGPEDRTLIIKLTGNLKRINELDWLKYNNYGYTVDFNILREDAPGLFNNSWLQGKSIVTAQLEQFYNGYQIIVVIE